MKTKDLVIGQAYAVVSSLRTGRYSRQTPAKAVVTAVNQERRYDEPHSFRTKTGKAHDGVAVEFEKKTKATYDGFVSSPEGSRVHVIRPQEVMEPWEAYAEKKAASDAFARAHERASDLEGDEVEPRIEEVERLLGLHGFTVERAAWTKEGVVSTEFVTRQGVNGARKIDAQYTLTLHDLARLLGAPWAQESAEVREA